MLRNEEYYGKKNHKYNTQTGRILHAGGVWISEKGMDAVACFVRPGEVALEQIRQIFPDREVVSVYTREIVYGGGNIHCITQQQPVPKMV